MTRAHPSANAGAGAVPPARTGEEPAGERVARLQRLTVALAGALTDEEVLQVVVTEGLDLLGACAGAVWTVAEDGRLVMTGSTGLPQETVARLKVVPLTAAHPTADAARERRTVLVRSPAHRDEVYPHLAGQASAGAALAAVPLTFRGELLGVLGANFVNPGALDDASNVGFLEAVAGQCAVALHRGFVIAAERRARAQEQAAVRRLGRLQAFTSRLSSATTAAEVADAAVSEAVSELGAARCVLALVTDDRSALTVVRSAGVADGGLGRFDTMPLDHAVPAADAVLSGEPIIVHSSKERDRRYPALRSFGPYGEHTLVVLPLHVEDEAIGSLTLSFDEVRRFDGDGDDDLGFLQALAAQCAQAIERSRLREGQRRSRRQLALLAETGRLFASSLDLELTLDQVCRLLVPAVVDMAVARVFDADGALRVVAEALVDPQVAEPLHRLWLRDDGEHLAHLRELIDAGRPEVSGAPELPDDLDEAALADIRALDLRSSALLPLRARGRALGLIAVGTRSGRPRLGESDAAFLHELAARVGLAVDNARLFQNQAEIAHTLQRSLLPAELPHVLGGEVAVAYRPGMEGTTVGGDFYDVIPLPSGRVGLVIGDVMGRGVRAAAVMGQLRAAVRSYALEGHPPAALLARLDRLVTTLEDGLLVTCVYGEWDPQRSLVTLACAGHLPPLVRRPGRRAEFVECDPGMPLGVGAMVARDQEVELSPGSLLLAYTDGLVEAPATPLSDGMAALVDAVGDRALSAAAVCDAVIDRLGRRPPPPDDSGAVRRHDDDIALLALLATGSGVAPPTRPDGEGISIELPADASSPARAREAVAATITGFRLPALSESLIDTAVLLASELVTNAVRHAGTALRLSVRRPAARRIRVEVTDHAPHAPVQPRTVGAGAEGGRGLFLVEALAAAWGSDSLPGGKTVWFELEHAAPRGRR